jgi:hypothetical protein
VRQFWPIFLQAERHTHTTSSIISYSSEPRHFFSSSSGLDTGFKAATSNAVSIDDHQSSSRGSRKCTMKVQEAYELFSIFLNVS